MSWSLRRCWAAAGSEIVSSNSKQSKGEIFIAIRDSNLHSMFLPAQNQPERNRQIVLRYRIYRLFTDPLRPNVIKEADLLYDDLCPSG